ncbi:hypothetical protein EXN66_Car014091 [Channa argus]|uniref:Uncharacterized protein n=1 Tax=Channa argus TaxID=215402 RepID=A0A6G1Q6Z1_CHAAH|nr:hypothetical protein EXN66_Car014091 [Channa argus]
MWMFLVIVALLDQNQAAPFAGTNSSSLQFSFQDQMDQTQPSAMPDVVQQQTASSSSALSSSADTSESSQSSEGAQQMRERQNLENTAANMENTAVEHMESSQESTESLPSPSVGNTSLWLNELVSLGQQAGERDRETDARDNSVESSRHRAQTFHPLLSRPQTKESSLTNEVNGATTPGGVVTPTVAGTGGAVGVDAGEKSDEEELPQTLDDSTEKADRQTFNLLGHPHHHGYHGNEGGLELGL